MKMTTHECKDCSEDHVEHIKELEAELRLRNDELRAIRHTIIVTVGGTDYEGFPTSEINWIQRLRILVEKERKLSDVTLAMKSIRLASGDNVSIQYFATKALAEIEKQKRA